MHSLLRTEVRKRNETHARAICIFRPTPYITIDTTYSNKQMTKFINSWDSMSNTKGWKYNGTRSVSPPIIHISQPNTFDTAVLHNCNAASRPRDREGTPHNHAITPPTQFELLTSTKFYSRDKYYNGHYTTMEYPTT